MKPISYIDRWVGRLKWLSIVLVVALLASVGLPVAVPMNVAQASPDSWTQTTFVEFDNASEKNNVLVVIVDPDTGDADVKLEYSVSAPYRNWTDVGEEPGPGDKKPIHGKFWVAQTFTTPAGPSAKVYSVVMYVVEDGSPPGELGVELWQTDSGLPDSSQPLLATAVADITAPGVYEVVFDPAPDIAGDTTYAIVAYQVEIEDSGANLNGAINDAVTSITVTDGTPFAKNDIIKIDDELLEITAVPVGTTLTVDRGINATVATSHSDGADIFSVSYVGDHDDSYLWYYDDNTPAYPDQGCKTSGGGDGTWSGFGSHVFAFMVNATGDYQTCGYLVSSAHDTSYAADFGTISWTADVLTDTTSVKFQIATSADNVTWTDFLGPGETSDPDDCYTTSTGEAIGSGHDGDQHIKYKAYFETTDTSKTPVLHDVTITYTEVPGSLQVTKVVDWDGVTPDETKTFEITITGPSYPGGDSKTADYDGEVLTWNNLVPGLYEINETNPGSEWETVITGSPATVVSGQQATATVTNTYNPAPTPRDRGAARKPRTYFTVDFLGEITKELMSKNSGKLLDPLEAPSPDEIHLLEMEEGTKTLDEDGDIVKLIEITEAGTPPPPEDTVFVGPVYDFQPSDITFSKPIRLTLGYDVNDLPEDVASVALAYYTSKTGWVELEAESDVVAEVGRLSAPVEHFTFFAVLASVSPPPPPPPALPPPPPPVPVLPAAFELSNLSITSSFSKVWELLTFAIKSGEEVTITVDVTNHGGQEGSYDVLLKVNGVTQATKEITLGAGQHQKITFTVTENEPGLYVVQIGDLDGEFQSLSWFNWWLTGGFTAVFILLGWLAWYYGYYRKKHKLTP